jgi:TolB-like protein
LTLRRRRRQTMRKMRRRGVKAGAARTGNSRVQAQAQLQGGVEGLCQGAGMLWGEQWGGQRKTGELFGLQERCLGKGSRQEGREG